jgi:hypothetical protein
MPKQHCGSQRRPAGDNLFRVERQKAARAIVERFPLSNQPRCACIALRAFNPVETAVPEAVLEYTGGYLLVCRAGRVLESGRKRCPKVIPGWWAWMWESLGEAGLTLHSEAGDKLAALRALIAAIESVGMEHIDLIDLTDELNMRLYTKTGWPLSWAAKAIWSTS